MILITLMTIKLPVSLNSSFATRFRPVEIRMDTFKSNEEPTVESQSPESCSGAVVNAFPTDTQVTTADNEARLLGNQKEAAVNNV